MANLLLLAAGACCFIGLGWLALAMDSHWKQVRKDRLSKSRARLLRRLGGSALLASLLFCLTVDHASMASLVWIMLLAASALSVAFTFSWRPHLLSVLVIWVKVTR